MEGRWVSCGDRRSPRSAALMLLSRCPWSVAGPLLGLLAVGRPDPPGHARDNAKTP
jgi:hypothetical protein